MRILEEYRIVIPQKLRKELEESINIEMIEEVISDGSGEVEIPFNGTKTCVELELLLEKLVKFLGPLQNDLPIFCFFHHLGSRFFVKCVEKKYSELLYETSLPLTNNPTSYEISTNMLHLAVEGTIAVVLDAVKGNITLKHMQLELSKDTSEEFVLFEFFTKVFHKYHEPQGHTGIEALLSLARFRNGMLIIEEMCTQCELVHCLEDSTFQELCEYADILRIPETIVLHKAPKIKASFCKNLPNYNGNFDVYFELFNELKNSFAYIQFCRKMGFVGEEGKRSFYAQRNLITQEIQYMLEQRALDDLWDAYTTLYYFIDSSITYHAWINGLKQLGNIETRVTQIKALQQHSILQLEQLFSRQEVSILTILSSIISVFMIIEPNKRCYLEAITDPV